MSFNRKWFGSPVQTPSSRRGFVTRCGLAALAVMLGCEGVRPITGGTPGTLQVSNQVASDLQLTFFRDEGGTWQPVGFATTGEGGRFELLLPGAAGPLRLEPGLYRVTVQTAGSDLILPPEVGKPATTPVQIDWTGREPRLQLLLPLAP